MCECVCVGVCWCVSGCVLEFVGVSLGVCWSLFVCECMCVLQFVGV